jgi:hypothetical protein
MSDTPPPARAGAGPPARIKSAAAEPRKLDDVLLAMDVVDTLRHRERIVDLELNAEAREQQLIARLKDIYGAQGIEVPEKTLRDGVKALEEQRFLYKPPRDSFSVRLARLYISRGRWMPIGAVVAVLAIGGGAIGWFAIQSTEAEWRRVPAEIVRLSDEGQALAIDPGVDARIEAMELAGVRAAGENDRDAAREQLAALRDLNDRLASEYDVRIVYRSGEETGFWRMPPNNPVGRNYYLIVEAVAPGGRLIDVPVRNEQTQKTERVSKWAQRVTQETFDKVREEKQGTGIVSNDILGRKPRGELEPKYDVPTPGGAITNWD